jgi:hypothetical protein
LQFHAVGTHVLHRRRTDGAGNQGHIFQTGVALRQGPSDKVVPALARARLHDESLGGFRHQSAPHHFHLQNHRFHIAREHNVAAPAQYKLVGSAPLRVRQQQMHIGFTGNADQCVGLGHDVEGVKGLERDVFLD